MGFLDTIRHRLNLGGARVAIRTRERLFFQGDTVAGEVRALGGAYPQVARSLTLQLQEFWTEKRQGPRGRPRNARHQEVHHSLQLSETLVLEAGTTAAFPFAVRLPRNARLSHVDGGWRLTARLDVGDVFSPLRPHDDTVLRVSPSTELMAFIKALEKGPRLREDPRHRSWDPKTREVRLRFTPPDYLKGDFDCILLYLRTEENGALKGRFVFDLQERRATDYLKAALSLDRTTHSFQLKREEFTNDGGTIRLAPLVQVFADSLDKVLAGGEGKGETGGEGDAPSAPPVGTSESSGD